MQKRLGKRKSQWWSCIEFLFPSDYVRAGSLFKEEDRDNRTSWLGPARPGHEMELLLTCHERCIIAIHHSQRAFFQCKIVVINLLFVKIRLYLEDGYEKIEGCITFSLPAVCQSSGSRYTLISKVGRLTSSIPRPVDSSRLCFVRLQLQFFAAKLQMFTSAIAHQKWWWWLVDTDSSTIKCRRSPPNVDPNPFI